MQKANYKMREVKTVSFFFHHIRNTGLIQLHKLFYLILQHNHIFLLNDTGYEYESHCCRPGSHLRSEVIALVNIKVPMYPGLICCRPTSWFQTCIANTILLRQWGVYMLQPEQIQVVKVEHKRESSSSLDHLGHMFFLYYLFYPLRRRQLH